MDHQDDRPSLRPSPAEVFAGGGELGGRMRAFDWAQTPLGPVEDWPQSLRTCVRIILTSRQPMFVWWGDALINLYNDAYKSIVGGKHPEALGQPASRVWREIWDAVGPRSESAMRLNEGTYDEALLLIMERHGYREETYYTFSYSPVPNDRGGTGGLICANTDDTRRIVGERQLALLSELAQGAQARTLQAACRGSAAALATNPRDLPFAAIYLVNAEQRAAVLEATSGIQAGHAASPRRIALDDPRWGLARALDGHEPVVRELDPLWDPPRGAWEEPPRQAAVIPLPVAGETGVAGLLVAGLNPFRLFDDEYRGFLKLVAGQTAANVAGAQAYEREKQRAEALAAIDRAKTAFFSNVSHEFRTPLTLMLGPLEDALAARPPALTGGNLETAHRNALRLLRLVNSLLDFSRIEAGRAQAAFAPVDLATLTAELAAMFRAAIERAGLAYTVDCEPLPETAYVDRELWEKVVLNLLSNAFKFTPRGGIEVLLRARGSLAELVVRDTGIGVPEEELPRLFERFHRVEGATGRTHEGSGIGLALVQELVHMHGGAIGVESLPGRGSTFTVTLPLGRRHLPAEHVRDTPAAVSRSTAAAFVEEAARWLPPVAEAGPRSVPAVAGRPVVLVADDNADMRDYVARILGERWEVRAVANGREALRVLRASGADLVLTDVMMPELDGYGLLREIRADPNTRGLPVIMLSARAGEESRVEGLLAGADDYLVKPFAARELLARAGVHLELGRLRAQLEGRSALFDEIFRQAPVAIATLHGPDLVFELANPLYLELVGGRDVVGKPLLEAIPELAGQRYDDLLREVIRSGQPQVGRDSLVRLDRGRGLEDTYWTFTFMPLLEGGGGNDRVVAVCNEVTDQVLSRRRLEALAEEAAQANRTKDEFLAMLGHELRNPLSPILTALQLLRMRGTSASELSVIERQVGHLVRLVDDLLDVSRITRGRVDLRQERLEVASVVLRGVEMASPLLEQRHQHLELSVPTEGLTVVGDPARLAQVVSNLLTNASKYSEPGARIELGAARKGDLVELRVRDEGIGITAETLGRIFDIFVQHPQALDRSKGGLGLGLAIVRSLVEQHGGSVRAQSDGPGKGSEFLVELPFAPGPPLPLAAAPPAACAALPARDPRRPRVLVVDDNRDAAETVAVGLEHMGCAVAIAHDGPSALEEARRFQPQVCLLDIGLPVMDGYELAQRLRGEATGAAALRLVALTGYGQEADRRRAREAGFDGHAVKPITLDALRDLILGPGAPAS